MFVIMNGPVFSSVHSVLSDSSRPHGPQHARPPCPSPTPGVYSNSSPSSLWCHPTISSSVIPFSSCLQSFPASGSFQMSQLFASGRQSIGVSASASVLPMNTQGWFPLRLRHESHLIFLGLFIPGQENKLNWPLKVKRSSLHSSSSSICYSKPGFTLSILIDLTYFYYELRVDVFNIELGPQVENFRT